MQLFSQVIGSGRPILILHGLFGMSDNWATIGKGLAQHGFSVHLLDMRNHGRSPHMQSHTFEDMCRDLLTYLDRKKLDKISIIGHSMGGKAAMRLGLLHPEKITDLIVVDIAPIRYCCHEGSLHAIIIDNLMQMDLSAYKNQTAIMTEIQRRLNNPILAMFLAKNIKRQSDNHYAWKLNLPVLKKYLPTLYTGFEELEAISPSPIRTLFIKGNLSDYIKPEYEPEMKRFFPNAHTIGIEKAGHWLHAEQPERFFEILTAFLIR